jgi:hypothetical protein
MRNLPKKKELKEESSEEKNIKKLDEETKPHEKKSSIWQEKKNLIIKVGLIVLIVAVLAIFYFYNLSPKVDENPVNMSLVKDLGAVKIRGDGLPGYDINRDGEADYIAAGFGYYKGIYEQGGFQYGPGGFELVEFDMEILLPELEFVPEEIVESGVGSVIIFHATDESSGASVRIILKTLGPALNTYNLIIDNLEGESYNIIDLLDEEGSGSFQTKEVEIVGRMMFRE